MKNQTIIERNANTLVVSRMGLMFEIARVAAEKEKTMKDETNDPDYKIYCSFCGKRHDEVEKIFSTDDYRAICSECVDMLSGELIKLRKVKSNDK